MIHLVLLIYLLINLILIYYKLDYNTC